MIEFRLPALGADMDEGTLLEWKVKPGDAVKKGQVVAVVDTSKAAVDVECWQEGTVHELLAEPGQKMAVGTVMATLLEAGETAPAKLSRGNTPEMERRPVSPAARRRARELGVDADTVAGSGPGGAVTVEDVEKAAARASSAAASAEDRTASMRRTIAAAMGRSKREIPHYYVAEDICMARALAWLEDMNAGRPMEERLLPAVLLVKAVAVALARFPELNGRWQDGAYVSSAQVNPGIAVSLRQGGLVAPALLDAAKKPLAQLMQELADLVARARAGTLKGSELSEGTITITNLGDLGSHSVFGIIYPPQVALVGFGRVAERPWVEDGRIVPRPVVTASLSADHRVSDGHRGALYLRELADLLQRPEEIDA